MHISSVGTNFNKISNNTKVLNQTATNTIRTIAPSMLSASAAAAIMANAMAKPVNPQEAKLKMINHQIDGKRVFDANAIQAMNGMKKWVPEWFDIIISNPANIKSLRFAPKSAETNWLERYSVETVDNSKTLSLSIGNMGKGNAIYEKIQKFVNPDGSYKTITTNAIQGSDKYKNTVLEVGHKSAKQTTEMDTVSDTLGLIYNNTSENIYDDKGRLSKVIETAINGAKRIGIYEYNSMNKIKKHVWTEYSPEGLINSKTTFDINYEQIGIDANAKPVFAQGKKVVTSIDYKNNTTSEAVLYSNKNILQSEVRKITNPKTGKVKTEIIEKSDIQGVYNSKIIDENGVEKIESLGLKNKDGSYHVEKHLESLDGTKTEYCYNSSPNKDNIDMSYQVITKDGEVLTSVDRKFKRISPERAYSSLNGFEHTMTKDNNGILIKDLNTNKEEYVSYKELFLQEEQLTKDNIALIDSLPADMILNLKNKKIKISITDKDFESRLQGNFMLTKRNARTLAHESGHSKDMLDETGKYRGYTIPLISNFKEKYEMEKSAYLKAFPFQQKHYIDYFTDDIHVTAGLNGVLGEMVAETNALFCLDFPTEDVALRQHYLQKYFPRSIASLSQYLNPHVNIAK